MNPFELDSTSVSEIERAFAEKQALARERADELFSVFTEIGSAEEELGLKFLFAYMPLNDLADYDGTLFLQHVRRSLEVRDLVPWGRRVPGDLFLSFILPYRMSNETIEDYRAFFYDELISRVGDKSMYEAILEINHWCHEKATYTSTDPRTASPLAMVKTAIGRCGEESALLVAALRSLCIPARQCYTPRWAHTDDNHAWVEAWADGRWYYLGACEPEPRLNMGWFAGPASRAMLVSAKIPGCYSGPEERVQSFDGYLSINLLSNYAPTRPLTVSVRDAQGHAAVGATVDFCVFNSGCFAPVTRLLTNEAGEATLTTGFGDLLVYASNGSGFGYVKASPDMGSRIDITLSDQLPEDSVFELEIVPPRDTYSTGEDVSEEERAAHNLRLKEEDRIRAQYESTFVSEQEAKCLAEELGLPAEDVCDVIKRARGNSHEMVAFLRCSAPRYGRLALTLLQVISSKDLTDTNRSVLMDHLEGAMEFSDGVDPEVFSQYVLNPRVSLEALRPYRGFFRAAFSSDEQRKFRDDPKSLVDWVMANIANAPSSLQVGCATPRGTYELRLGGTESRKVLFVALARTFGIPARLVRADRRIQYLGSQGWVDVSLDKDSVAVSKDDAVPVGDIGLSFAGDCNDKPEYFRNFTIARFDGFSPRVLNFYGLDGDKIDKPISVPAGYYWLTTGTRLADGTVLARVTTFRVRQGELTQVDLKIRQEEDQLKEYGSLPSGLVVNGLDGGHVDLDSLIVDPGAVIAFIEPDREPSKHLLRELGELRAELERVAAPICLIIGDAHLTESFRVHDFGHLPSTARFAIDRGGACQAAVAAGLTAGSRRGLPLVLVVDSKRSERYVSAGYKLGTGTDVLRLLRSLVGSA
jgi:hypothetical protein